jgi:hypothetical protein
MREDVGRVAEASRPTSLGPHGPLGCKHQESKRLRDLEGGKCVGASRESLLASPDRGAFFKEGGHALLRIVR